MHHIDFLLMSNCVDDNNVGEIEITFIILGYSYRHQFFFYPGQIQIQSVVLTNLTIALMEKEDILGK